MKLVSWKIQTPVSYTHLDVYKRQIKKYEESSKKGRSLQIPNTESIFIENTFPSGDMRDTRIGFFDGDDYESHH